MNTAIPATSAPRTSTPKTNRCTDATVDTERFITKLETMGVFNATHPYLLDHTYWEELGETNALSAAERKTLRWLSENITDVIALKPDYGLTSEHIRKLAERDQDGSTLSVCNDFKGFLFERIVRQDIQENPSGELRHQSSSDRRTRLYHAAARHANRYNCIVPMASAEFSSQTVQLSRQCSPLTQRHMSLIEYAAQRGIDVSKYNYQQH